MVISSRIVTSSALFVTEENKLYGTVPLAKMASLVRELEQAGHSLWFGTSSVRHIARQNEAVQAPALSEPYRASC